ncbi:hypothetical protein ACWC09_26680 [Streptomyces sp. NPDC001617]
MPQPTRDEVAARLWQVAEHNIIAEWICCDPIDPTHQLCVKGDATLKMTKALLVDSPQAWKPAPLLDAVMEELRRLAAEVQQPETEEEGELVCVDECGNCDACGMEPFGTPAEGWREAARFLRRTPRDSADFPGAIRGARLIEDELRRRAEDAQQNETADTNETEAPPVCEGFRWIGQSFACCDRCGQPAWDHVGEEIPVEGAGPFDNRRTVRPWEPGQADRIRAKWGTPADGEVSRG